METKIEDVELSRIGWKDEPSEETPIDSGNLKKSEENVQTAINTLKANIEAVINGLGNIFQEIEEQKIEDDEGYIKYKDGKLIQWGVHTYSVGTNDSYYNIGYRSGELYFGGEEYKIPFKKITNLQISHIPSDSSSFISVISKSSNKLTKLPNYTYVSAGKQPNLMVDCYYYAIGTWK